MFRKSPGFALVAVLALAFGIGVNSAIFTLLNAIALRPLPVYNPGEVVTVYQMMQGLRDRNVHGSRAYLSYPEYTAYRDQSHVFTGLGGACRRGADAGRSRSPAGHRIRGLLQLLFRPGPLALHGARISRRGMRRALHRRRWWC